MCVVVLFLSGLFVITFIIVILIIIVTTMTVIILVLMYILIHTLGVIVHRAVFS